MNPKYKEYELARNSKAYELYMAKEFKLLDKHLKELEQNEKALLARYSKQG
jgi:uridine kinase